MPSSQEERPESVHGGAGTQGVEKGVTEERINPTKTVVNKPAIVVKLDGIPEELRKIAHWGCWKFGKPKHSGAKAPKIFYSVASARPASPTKAESRCGFAQAATAYKNSRGYYDGVGFVPILGLSVVLLDLDKVRDLETGELLPQAAELVDRLNTYTEVSPSGTGLRLVVKGHLPDGMTRANVRDFFGEGTGLEAYSGGQYLTMTGHRINDQGIMDRQAELDALAFDLDAAKPEKNSSPKNDHRGEFLAAIKAERNENPDAELDGRDKYLLEKIFASKGGAKFKKLWDGDTSDYPSASEADAALAMSLAFWLKKDPARTDRFFRNSELFGNLARSKAWDSPRAGGHDYGSLTICSAIENQKTVYSGVEPDHVVDAEEESDWMPLWAFEEEYGAALAQKGKGPFDRRASEIRPEDLKPRQRVLGSDFIIGQVTLTQGSPGVSKSAFSIGEALAVAAGHDDLGFGRVHRGGAVVIYNGEDGVEEMENRLFAAAAHHGLDLSKCHPVVYVSGQDHPFRLVGNYDGGLAVHEKQFLLLVEKLKALGVKLLVLDPLVKLHGLRENDNAEMDAFMRVLVLLARTAEVAISLIHHVSKSSMGKNGDASSMDAGRGASSLSGAARVVRNLVGMSSKEAKSAGIPESERRDYVKLDQSKNNLSRPEDCRWFRKVGVKLPSNEYAPVLEPVKLGFAEVLKPESDPEFMNALVAKIAATVGEPGSGKRLTARSLSRTFVAPWSTELFGLTAGIIEMAIRQGLADGRLVEIEEKAKNNKLISYIFAGEKA